MHSIRIVALCLSAVTAAAPLRAQRVDSTKAPQPYWFDKVVYGGGPSVGAPPSDFDGSKPPGKWCLTPVGRGHGDYGMAGWPWMEGSKGWLRDILSDTTDFGRGWRKVLGNAPLIGKADSIVHVTDEPTCKAVAAIVNRDVLGWKVGPPPIVILRVRDHLVAYPSNARRGEWGIAVGMTVRHEIRGVAAW